MLYHHDSRDYGTAAKDAGDRARAKLQKIVDSGRPRATQVLNTIYETVPRNRLVRGDKLRFVAADNGVEVMTPDGTREGFHPHALGQLAQRSEGKITKGQVDTLCAKHTSEGGVKDFYGARLLATMFNELYSRKQDRYLTRSVNGQVRGFLSDRFKMIDVRPSVDAFVQAMQEVGGVAIEGYDGQIKTGIKAVIPTVFEPVPNEVMVFGASLLNSDYGAGALSIKPFILRLWCTNYAIMEESLRAVHLGAQLENADLFSNDTIQLTSRAWAAQIGDTIKGVLARPRIEQYCEVVRKATTHTIDFKKEVEALKRKGVQKEELADVTEIYINGGIEQLPMGENKWRLSNAISWVAGQTENPIRKLDLMEIAGSVLPPVPRTN